MEVHWKLEEKIEPQLGYGKGPEVRLACPHSGQPWRLYERHECVDQVYSDVQFIAMLLGEIWVNG
jgi:hypothetical protein